MNKLDYLKKIKRYFPEIKFKNSKLIEKGWDHDVIVLDNKYIFRFPKKEKYQERLKSEMKFLKYLAPRMGLFQRVNFMKLLMKQRAYFLKQRNPLTGVSRNLQ